MVNLDPCNLFSSCWFNDEHIDSLSLASFNCNVNEEIFSSNSVTAAETGTADLEANVGEGLCF